MKQPSRSFNKWSTNALARLLEIILVTFITNVFPINAEDIKSDYLKSDTSLEHKVSDSTFLRKSMVYSIGYSKLRMNDRQATPLIYSATSVPLQFGFQRISNKNEFNLNLVIDIGSLHPKRFKTRTIEAYGWDDEGDRIYKTSHQGFAIIMFGINSEYLAKTRSFLDNKVHCYVGGQVLDYFMFTSSITPFYFNQLSLNPKAFAEYTMNKKIIFSSSLSFPIISLISRLPYSRDIYTNKNYEVAFFQENTRLETLNRFQRFDLNFTAQTRLSKKWQLGIGYKFYWFHDSEKMGMKAYDNAFQIQFIRMFKNKSK